MTALTLDTTTNGWDFYSVGWSKDSPSYSALVMGELDGGRSPAVSFAAPVVDADWFVADPAP
jgi:hypothetical protein